MSALSPAILAELGVSHPGAAAQQLEAYLDLVLDYGERLNLVGRPERGFVARDLILGSLQLLRAGLPRGRLADVGSGAGLPGIPLAVALPALHVSLIEPRQKRVAFLEKVVRSLALHDRIEIIPEPVEAVLTGRVKGRAARLPFDWAVARAFRPPTTWLELADRLLAPGGRAALYTTRRRFPSLAAVDPEGRFREVARVEDETGDDRVVVVVERVDEGSG